MMKKLLLGVLAGTLMAGCQTPILSPERDAEIQPLGIKGHHGVLRLRMDWPATPPIRTQYVPRSSMRAEFSVAAESGEVLAARTITRTGSADMSASLELAPGTGYTVSVGIYDGNDVLLASGISASFSIERQKIATIGLTALPILSTIAGTGATAYSGDEVPAVSTGLFLPLGLAIAPNGDLLIADSSNHAVRRMNAGGAISTITGTGSGTQSNLSDLGDDGPAVSATLKTPNALAFSPAGDLFIADTMNKRVRILPAEDGARYGMTLTAGRLHTLYLSAHKAPYLVGVASDRAGNVFVGEGDRLMMLTPGGEKSLVAGIPGTLGAGSDGLALESSLKMPEGLIVDAVGNLLFAERSNHRVRMLCRQAGTNFGIAMASGSVYTLAGEGNATSASVPLGDGGDALEASFASPRGLALDADGNLFVADAGNGLIRRMTPDRVIATFELGGSSALELPLKTPVGLVIHEGRLLVGDSGNHRIRSLPL